MEKNHQGLLQGSLKLDRRRYTILEAEVVGLDYEVNFTVVHAYTGSKVIVEHAMLHNKIVCAPKITICDGSIDV